MTRDRNRTSRALRSRFLYILLLLALTGAAGAESGDQRAGRFVRLLFDGDAEATHDLMSPQMQRAFGADGQKQLREQLTAQSGAVGSIGAAWLQDTVQGYDRYRVPVAFEKATLDLLVVLDGSGLVGGLYVQAHVEPPSSPAKGKELPETHATAPGREIAVAVGEGEDALPGLLTLPREGGPFAGVVLVHGSGPNDKDETVGAHKVFRDLAWGLAERGVATLRYDKRSFAHPQGLIALGQKLTVDDEVIRDAVAALRLLRERPEIDSRRVYVLGHSLGGTLVPRIAAAEPRPAGMISLAGAALPLPEKMVEQTRYIVSVDGEISKEEKAKLSEVEEAAATLRAALDGQGPEPKGYVMGAPFGYYRDLEAHDPPAEAAALGIRVFVAQGERDYQVTMEDFARWKKALQGHAGACLESYPGLDHLFSRGEGPSKPEDYQKPGPFSPRVLDDLAGWILSGRCP